MTREGMFLKREVMAAPLGVQTAAAALERVKGLLSDKAIVEALRAARAGDRVEDYHRAFIPLTVTELHALQVEMGKANGDLRRRVWNDLPEAGIAVVADDRGMTLALLGDPPPRAPRHDL